MLIFLRRGQTKNLPPPFPGLENPEVEAACARRSSPCQLGSLSTTKVSPPIYFLSKQYFHCILAAMRTSPTSSIQKQGHWCVSCIDSVKNVKSSIVVIMLVSRWQVPIPSASSPRPKEFPPVSGLVSTFSPPTWQHLYSTWNSRQLPSYFYISVKPFVQQLHLFSCNIPEEDVPCRLFIFTPTAWIQAENHKIFWLLFSGGFEPHGERVWTWREQPGWVGWIWKKISHGLLLYKAASMLILKYWYWGDLFAWIKRILWKALLGGLELCVWCWKSMIFCLSSF